MSEYQSIVQAIANHAAVSPNKTALIDAKTTVSYAELYVMIRAAAERLMEMGLKPGDRVILIAQQSVAYAAVTFGVQLAGGVIVPLERNSAQSRVQSIAGEVGAAFVAANTSGEYGARCVLFSELLSQKELTQSAYLLEKLEVGALSKIMFTTGTTGKSKGVMISHAIQTAVAQNISDSLRFKTDDVTVIPLPLNHGYGYKRLYTAMYAGITAVLSENILFAKSFVSLAVSSGATILHVVPAHFKLLLSLGEKEIGKLEPKLRLLEFGAAALPETVKESAFSIFPNAAVCMSYGCTEAAATSFVRFERATPSKCIGKPMLHSDVFVVDEQGKRFHASKEKPGRIVNTGKTIMLGYWNEPELTGEALRDGLVFTNDLGYYDEKERLCFAGRMGDVINIGGIKVSPAEIEDAALSFGGVEECACISGNDPVLGCIPLLFVHSKSEGFSARELFEYLLKKIDPITVPKRILQIDEIPKTENGKIDRKKLREAY